MNRIGLCVAMLLSVPCFGMQLIPIIKHDNGVAKINGYMVRHNGETKAVNSYDVDSFLKDIEQSKLDIFQKQGGHIRISKTKNGDYILRHTVEGKGGGPILAAICTAGVLVVGGVVTVGATIGTTVVTLNPAAGLAVGATCASGTAAAATWTAVAMTVTPAP